MPKKYVVAIVIAAVIGVFTVGVLAYRGQQADQAAQIATRNLGYLVRADAPTLGKPTAKVHIVEFMDPACETCASFYPLVKQMLASHPGEIRLSVRHVAFHPGADLAVRILEASRAQGKYWETLEALLSRQSRWVVNHRALPDATWAQLDGVGLDLVRLRADMDAPEVAQRIAQDTSDAKALRVTATPEYFVNGHPLPDFGYEQLNTLVQNALAQAY